MVIASSLYPTTLLPRFLYNLVGISLSLSTVNRVRFSQEPSAFLLLSRISDTRNVSMGIQGHEFSPKEKAEIMDFPLEPCCFCIPRVGRWARGVNALMKVREWTEIAASLRWKTFVRRSKSGGGVRHGKFQYDPLSYALNFDDGEGQQNRDLDDEEYVIRASFSLRYAALPVSSDSSMDLVKDAPTFT